MQPNPPDARTRRLRSIGRARGFTLLELAVVVIIISVFAALAIPQITRQLRDNKVRETAQRIAMTYRNARLRAMGQGSAVLVSYSAGTNAQGRVVTREALVGTGGACVALPSPSCLGTAWTGGAEGTDFRTIRDFSLGQDDFLDNVFLDMHSSPQPPQAGAQVGDMHVCFTPLGRAFVSYVPAPALGQFEPLVGVPRGDVYRMSGAARVGLTRNVLVLPSGAARLQL